MPFAPLWGYLLRGVLGMQVAVLTIYGNISVLLFVLLILKKGVKNLIFPKYLYPILLLAIYYSLWDLYNGNVDDMGVVIIFFRNYHLFAITTILLIVNSHFSDDFIKKLIFLLKLTIIPAVIVSIIQAIYNPLFLTPQSYLIDNLAYLDNPYELRPPSIFGYLDSNDLGLSFIPIISLIISYSLITDKKKKITFFLIFLGGLSCVLSNGRYIMLGYVIVLSQILLYYELNFKRAVSLFLAVGLGTLLLLIILTQVIGYDLKDYSEERIMSESASTRIFAIENFLKFFPHNVIFGTGVRVSDELQAEIGSITSQIHVGYLSVFFEYGIVGGVLTLLYWYKIMVAFYRNAKMTHFWGSVFGFLSFLFANIALVQYFIYFYGIILLFILDSYFKQKTAEESNLNFSLRVV
jgi:hypothetical protein